MHRRLNRAALAIVLAMIPAIPAFAAQTEVFTITPAFSPFSVAGRSATIKGIGFTPGTTVDFDGTPAASVIFINARTIVAVIPTVPSARITTVNVTDPVNGSDGFFPFMHTGPAIYVATTGNDGNAGTSPASPKLTIGAALAAVDEITPTEIRAAGGLYVESQLELLNATALSCGWAPGFGLRDPDGFVTEINGGRTGFVIRTSGLMNNSVIDGCTISNGFRDGFGGGGLAITADSTIINNSVIAGNTSSIMGGGIYWRASTSYGGTPTFSNSIIVGNRASNKNGGGIGVYQSYDTIEPVELKITANQIVGNRSLNGRGGGFSFGTGTYVGYNDALLSLSDNVLAHNIAKSGGGVNVTTNNYADRIDFSMQNNLLFANSADGSGGGISFQGLGVHGGSLVANTVADNAGGLFQGGGLAIGGSITLDPSWRGSDMVLWNNFGGDFVGIGSGSIQYSLSGSTLAGPGNLNTDPLFSAGQFSSYYLEQDDPNLPVSPAVDAGSAIASEFALDALTTSAADTLDGAVNDMGFHHLLSIPDSPNPVSVLRVDPARGDVNGNDWLLVRGEGFDPGATVFFNGFQAADQMFLTNRKILARPAAHAEGFANVRVFNPDNSNATLVSGYLYLDNNPPIWSTTVGVITASGGTDTCDRTVLLDWNEAVDMDSPPVVYEIYREECIVSIFPGIPCDNFGYIPNSTNLIATTSQTWFLDDTMSTTGQATKWVYNVRARDSANFFNNRERNFGKRVALGDQGSVEIPPEEIGNVLTWVQGTDDTFSWQNSTGASEYGFYRTDDASDYSTIPTLPLLINLTVANNDGNADGITDTMYTDLVDPPVSQAFYYKVSARDKCGGNTVSELLP